MGQSEEDIPEPWCLKSENDKNTYAYLKDSVKEQCYALTTDSLYPSQLNFEDDYNPEELTLVYQSETACPLDPGNNFSITFYFECREDEDGEYVMPRYLEYVEAGGSCDYYVKIFDEVGCPVLSMPAFTIFID